MVIDAQEKTKLWRAADIGDVELLHAKYVRYGFARHTHEGVAIGVIEDGAESLWYHGANHVATRGNIVVFNPGEVHTGQGADEHGWTFRIFYMDARLLQRAASETAGRAKDIPFFRQPMSDASRLERQSCFIWAFAQLVQKHADDPPIERSDASSGKIGSPIDRVLLLCYQYDPTTARYSTTVLRLLRLAGVLTVAALVLGILIFRRRDTTISWTGLSFLRSNVSATKGRN